MGDLHKLAGSLARTYLIDFITVTKPNYTIKWYHELLCEHLDKLLRNEIKKLMCFLPPQHGKSEIVSRRLPALALGQDPNLKIASCTYTADLAARFNREVQRIMDDPVYKEIFPATNLNDRNVVTDRRGNWLRNSEEFEIVNKEGSYKSVGVGGALIGNRVDLGIIDDPIKDRMEAQSELMRNRLWEWYLDVFCTRLHNDSRVLLTMTRWHEDDLAGRILANENDWVVLTLPALKEAAATVPADPRKEGESLWEEKHSAEKILKVKAKSERTFISMYQQQPRPLGGGLFKDVWFKYYRYAPPKWDKLVISWDCAFKDLKSSDFVAGTVWMKVGADAYLIDVVRGQWGFVKTLKMILQMKAKHPEAREVYVEDKANGTAVIEVLKKKVPGLIPVTPTESKDSRASAVSYLFEAGNVFFPEAAPWLKDYKDELLAFDSGAHDDQVDSTTQALQKLYDSFGIDYEKFLRE